MNISIKLSIMMVLIVLLTSITVIIYKNYEEKKIIQFFHDEQNDKEANFTKLMDLKIQDMKRSVDNYTYWDDMVYFVTVEQNKKWIAENIDTMLTDFSINSIWIYNINTSLLYSVNDLGNNSLKESFLPREAFNRLFGQSRFCHFCINTSEGLMDISGATIHPTADPERKTPPRGCFFAGRLIDKDYVVELSRLIGGMVELVSVSDMEKSENTPGKKDGMILFSKTLIGWDKTPLAYLKVTIKSSVIPNFSHIFRNVFSLFISVNLGIVIIVLVFFLHWIANPLRLISDTLRTENPFHTSRLQKSRSEFGDVARLINRFFEQRENLINEIAERKHTEEALRKSEKKYRELYENMRDASATVNMNGQITGFNSAFQEMLEYNEEEIYELCYEEITPERWHQTEKEILEEQVLKMGYSRIYEKEYIKKDGSIVPVELRTYLIRGEEGNAIGMWAIVRDITERKNAEERLQEKNRLLEETLIELKTTQQKVIQQERLRALGQLASGIAHDFNNAMTPILGYSDMLLEAPQLLQDEKRVHRYMKLIHTAAGDARDIVNRLKEFYRNREEDEVFTLVELNDLIRQAVQFTELKWKNQVQANGITISVLTDLQDVPPVSGSQAELREVLTNLIFNAVDAMPAGGTIYLRTRSVGTEVVLEVNDTGVGMTEEIKRQCFEPFFSTKGMSGTGLGLSVVHGIIRRHRGTIEIESEVGKGTTFIIHLPIPAERQYKEKAHEEESFLQPLRVLVVDDEPLIQEMLGDYLASDGHTFEIASNGHEGLAKLRAGSFNLVITDRAMPNMGGDQLADFIKQNTPGIPIIMLTGFGSIMEALGEMPEHIDYLLSKPVTLSAFRKALGIVGNNSFKH